MSGYRRGARLPLAPSLDLDQSASPWPPPEQIAARPSPPPFLAQLVHHRPEDPRARGADRMTERDGAAVDVHLFLVGAEHLRGVEHDRGERLVQPGPARRRRSSCRPSRARPLRSPARPEKGSRRRAGPGDRDGRQDPGHAPLRELLAGTGTAALSFHQRRTATAVPPDRRWPEGCKLPERGVPSRAFIGVDVAHRNDLVGKSALVDRLDRRARGAERPPVQFSREIPSSGSRTRPARLRGARRMSTGRRAPSSRYVRRRAGSRIAPA